MQRKFVKVEKGVGPQGRVAVVRFDRGDNINALSQQAMRELRDVPRDFEDDLETTVVILTGSAKAFSAGFDLKDPEGRQRDTLSVGERIHRQRLGPKMCKAWEEMDQVTIAAIEGHCIGGGAALVVALDFRTCGRSAHFRIPEVELALGRQHQGGADCELLADRGDAKARVWPDRHAELDAGEAVALAQLDLAAAHHGDDGAGRALLRITGEQRVDAMLEGERVD